MINLKTLLLLGAIVLPTASHAGCWEIGEFNVGRAQAVDAAYATGAHAAKAKKDKDTLAIYDNDMFNQAFYDKWSKIYQDEYDATMTELAETQDRGLNNIYMNFFGNWDPRHLQRCEQELNRVMAQDIAKYLPRHVIQ